MLEGVGTDIIEINRIEHSIRRFGDRFLYRIFTSREINTARTRGGLFFATLAARFAAKEAILKTLGTGLRGCKWAEIEILSRESGCPRVNLYGKAVGIARDKGITDIHVSMSHCRDYAVAFAVAERNGDFENCNR